MPFPFVDPSLGYHASAAYLRQLLDRIEQDIIMPIVISSTEATPFRELLEVVVGTYNEELHKKGKRLDFGDDSTRWAYVYVFLMRHSHLVHTALVSMIPFTQKFAIWQNIPQLRMVAIGGGPGSDVLGFALFLKTLGITSNFHATIIDRCNEWKKTWASLRDRTQDLPISQVDFISEDLTSDGLSSHAREAIKHAHLITLVKVISSISAFIITKPVPQRLAFLETVTPGTYVLYIDNSVGPHTDLFMETIQYARLGFKLVNAFTNDVEFPLGPSSNQPLVEWLSFYPAKCGMNNFILLQKVC
ncbi:hypothetical protein HOLleu_25220 [Holothuria leucospilota]|uniref:Uncharacterized protein n=1 Tax=Holothuria leucospilota TaxID=206669 RepID=A0A9Q1H1Q5_HOLLE|nr:hypothetical protein HOLleu_25220 [Holothuria leucospilota]